MSLRFLVCLVVAGIATAAPPCPASPQDDPIDLFITRADSMAREPGGEGLSSFVAGNGVLVGAAVGRLAEAALELRVDGRVEAAAEDLKLAEDIAEIHCIHTESTAPRLLVATYRGWTDDQIASWQKARSLEAAATEARDSGDFDRAIGLLEQAMAVYESIGDKRAAAVLWGTLGVVAWYKGDFESAAGYYEKALAARRGIDDRILEGKTLNGLGSANLQLGNFDLARQYYEEAVKLRRLTGDMAGLATSLNYLGNVYLSLGRLLEARTMFEEALPVVESTGDRIKRFELLISIADLNADMGRVSDSDRKLEEALSMAIDMADPRRQAICRNNLAFNLTQTFRYAEALQELALTKSLLEQQPDPEQTAAYLLNSAVTNMGIGELAWAESDLDSLLELATSHGMRAFELEGLLNMGYMANERHQYEDGLIYAGDAVELAREMENPKMLRKALILSTEIEHRLGHYDESIATWKTMLAEDEQRGIDADIALDRMGIANNLVMAGEREEGRRIFREAADAAQATQQGDLVLALAFGVGHSFEKTDPESARFYYDMALDMLDSTRKEVGSSEVRTGFLGGTRRFYFEEVARYYAGLSGGKDGAVWSGLAFQTIERAKARGLLDLIEAAVLAAGSPAEDALLDSLYSLDPEAPGYARHKRDLEDEYQEVRNLRLAALPGRGVAAPEIAGPEDARKALPASTAMLAYALGDSVSLLWVIDDAGCDVYRLPPRSLLESRVEDLRKAISEPVIGDDMLRTTARRLYEDLIAPASRRIAAAHRLVVVPDGMLFELPFEVLLTEEPADGSGWKDMAFLARRYEVIYVPSASIYLALRLGTGNAPYARDLLALGDPDYSLLRPLPGQRGRFQALPFAREEVNSISSHLEAARKTILLGADANEAALKARLKDGSVRVVHLAAHGIVDPAEPIASCVVLCPDKEGEEDGYFRTLEVMSIPIDAGLVVLSACESARGRIGRGEGVIGLGRAFLASGAKGVVAGLWSVSDQSTAALMEEFYSNMFERREPAGTAMNNARLVLMDDLRYAHPYYWSPFVVIASDEAPW
jgi:CHAT domain-containing protein/tetratricopeptide (TPR) repeat protein